jgi:hypothetical protein
MDLGVKNIEAWDKWVTSNQDSYGKACVDCARFVMEQMERDIKSGVIIQKGFAKKYVTLADETLKTGITGFMAGAIAQMVSQCSEYGSIFRQDWNGEYNVTSEGVVNPAILTVKTKEDENN